MGRFSISYGESTKDVDEGDFKRNFVVDSIGCFCKAC